MSSQLQGKSTPVQTSPYSSIPGYRSNEPMNSPWNRQITAYAASKVPYTVESFSPRQEKQSSSKQSQPPSQPLGSLSMQPTKQSSVTVSANVLAKSDALRSQMGLQPLENTMDVFESSGTQSISVNPDLEQSIVGSFSKNPSGLISAGTAKGSYLYGLYQKGVLTQSDLDKINQISAKYNANVDKQNVLNNQQNIQAQVKEQSDITNTLQQAKSAGLVSMNVLDTKGNIIGTVNPQNISQAKSQTLSLLGKVGGAGSLQGTVTTKSTVQGTTSTLTTQNYREDPLSLFARPVLEFGASVGLPIIEAFQGKIQESPLQAFLTGKQNNPITPVFSESVSSKLDSTFGMNTEVQQITSGKLSAPQRIAAILGVATAVAIPTFAGFAGLGKVSETENISVKAKTPTSQSISKITTAFNEKPLEVFTQNIGFTKELSQGTELKLTPSAFKYEEAPIQIQKTGSKIQSDILNIGGGKTVKVSEKVPNGSIVQAIKPVLPKGISLTQPIKTIGPKGELKIMDIPNVLQTTSKEAGEAKLPYAYLSDKQVAFIRGEPSKLPEEKFIVSGKVKPEVISTLGLEPIVGAKDTFISPKLTKGMSEYLEQAEKAGLITDPLSEIHLQSMEDVLATPESPYVYAETSRNPDLFNTKAFKEGGLLEGITRPQVIKYREAYPIKTQTFKIKDLTPRNLKPMKPFGSPPGQGKVGAGNAGRAEALMKEIIKPESKVISKPEIFRTEKPVKSQSRFTGISSIMEEETTFIQYPKNAGITSIFPQVKSKAKNTLTSRFTTLSKNKTINDEIAKFDTSSKLREGLKINQEKQNKQTSKLIISSIPIQSQIPKIFQTTSQKITTKQVTGQITVNEFPFNPKAPNFSPPPPSKKKIPGLPPFWLPNPTQGPGGPGAGEGSRKGFVGNVPEYEFTGMYNRPETIYGNPRTPKNIIGVTGKPVKGTVSNTNKFVFNSNDGKSAKQGKTSRKSLSSKFNNLI